MTAARADPTERLLVIGANFRSSTARVRVSLLSDSVDHVALLSDLRQAALGETLLLATCDRLEVVCVADDMAARRDALRALFARWAEIAPEDLDQELFERRGEAALRHLFAVAASLDSQVVGEPQVLGQVKESHRQAAEVGLVGPALEAALQGAYGAAKRVRNETPLAEGSVTLVAAALQVARQLHGSLSRSRALLLGLGEISELMAAELREAEVADITVVHSSSARSETVARRIGGHFRPWSELDEALVDADIVVSAVGSGRYTLGAAQIEQVLRRRRRRPIFFIDSALPSDVEPAVEKLDGAFVYDLADLEAVAREGRAGREDTARAAWRVLEEEVASFRRQRAERTAVPAVAQLRSHFEWVREQVLSHGKLDAESATRLLIKRLLHGPSQALRGVAAEDRSEAEQLAESLTKLFPIEPSDDQDDDEERAKKGKDT